MFNGLFASSHGIRSVQAAYIGWIGGSLVAYLLSLFLDAYSGRVMRAVWSALVWAARGTGKGATKIFAIMGQIATRMGKYVLTIITTIVVAQYIQSQLVGQYAWMIDWMNSTLAAAGMRYVGGVVTQYIQSQLVDQHASMIDWVNSTFVAAGLRYVVQMIGSSWQHLVSYATHAAHYCASTFVNTTTT